MSSTYATEAPGKSDKLLLKMKIIFLKNGFSMQHKELVWGQDTKCMLGKYNPVSCRHVQGLSGFEMEENPV